MSDWLQAFSESKSGALFITFLAFLGLLSWLQIVYRLFRGVWIHFLRLGRHLKTYGKWAVVTGATDGIGLAYAEALAARGKPCCSLRLSKGSEQPQLDPTTLTASCFGLPFKPLAIPACTLDAHLRLVLQGCM